MGTPTEPSASWEALKSHSTEVSKISLRDHFAQDPNRANRFSIEVGDLWIDYSKQPITTTTIDLLIELAAEREVSDFIQQMAAGEKVNETENRPALHTALRATGETTINIAGTNIVPIVQKNLEQMTALANKIRTGKQPTSNNSSIRSVVSLGVGGSYLGPAMAIEALADYADPNIDLRFVSNLDRAELTDTLKDLDPLQTLIVIISKSFTTSETLIAAESAKAWLTNKISETDLGLHLAAVTSVPERAISAGIDPELVFYLPEWVGGRFSLPSAVGLPLMISIGPDAFIQLLTGMRKIDEHIANTSEEICGPIILGLIDVWLRSFLGSNSLAVVPYSSRMDLFPKFLQQLMMESLGKRIDVNGNQLKIPTGGVLWGSTGTNAQHTFFQFLHQGTEITPCDMIGFARTKHDPENTHQDALIANLLAQSSALAFGRIESEIDKTHSELKAHKETPGNRPSNVILAPELSPEILGQLVALYEYRTITAGKIWGINPFDQWGVELGKELASQINTEITSSEAMNFDNYDGSTENLIRHYKKLRNQEKN